ncbi:MAG: hypothetical protein ACE5OS_00560 [Anaerolineae bacterium]
MTKLRGRRQGAMAVLAGGLAAALTAMLMAVALAAPRMDFNHSYLNLSDTETSSVRPDLAVSPDGNRAAVVWTEAPTVTDMADVYLRVFSFGNWGGKVVVFSYSGEPDAPCAYNAAVAATNSQARVVYVLFGKCGDMAAGAEVRYATCSLPSGPCTDRGTVVSVSAPQRILWVDLALDTGGNPHVVWAQYANETAPGKIKYRAYDGTSWGGIEDVGGGGEDGYMPAIAWANGYAHVVWREGQMGGPYDPAYVKYRGNSGSGWSGSDFSQPGFDLGNPDVAAWGSRVFVVWDQCCEYTNPSPTYLPCEKYYLVYRRSNENGTNWPYNPREVGTDYTALNVKYYSVDDTIDWWGKQYLSFLRPSIALNDEGWPAVAWHADASPTPGDREVYTVRYTYSTGVKPSDGVTWTSTITVGQFRMLGSAAIGVAGGEGGGQQLHVAEMQPFLDKTWGDVYHDYYDYYTGGGGPRFKYIYLPLVFRNH